MAGNSLSQAEREELEALRAQKAIFERKNKLTAKIGAKGGISVYGMGRFPVTLYKEQWERLIGFVPELQAFIEANKANLATKNKPTV